jgi:hypothetical protein
MAQKPTNDQMELLRNTIRENDFAYWLNREKIKLIAAKITVKLGFTVPVRAVSTIRKDVCVWWGHRKRRQPSAAILLDESGWDKLRMAVQKHKDDLAGRKLDEAVAIVSITQRCNRMVLAGLPQRFKFWGKGVGK